MTVTIGDLSKRFNGTRAIDGVSLEIAQGELLALLGPSGSGKTTLLRIIAGLEQADCGSLSIHGQDALQMPARQRGIGFVFQNYALFRHMTAADNVGFGLSVRPRGKRPSRAAIAARVAEMLQLVQLDGLGHRFPSELSGGQQQRVALARALAVEPKLLLLDEPFGALDAKVRVELRHWLRRLHDKLGLTTIFVTHDQEEALELADRVAILNAGRIEQVDRSRDVYERPASSFVMEFLGEVNKLPCRIIAGVATLGPRGLRIDGRGLPEGPAIAYVRPHEIGLDCAPGPHSSEAIVRSLSMIGPRTRLNLGLGDIALAADIDRSVVERLALAPGRPVFLQFTMVRLFPVPPSAAGCLRDSGRDDPRSVSRDLPLKRQMRAVRA